MIFAAGVRLRSRLQDLNTTRIAALKNISCDTR
jgi:hypothetical protein